MYIYKSYDAARYNLATRIMSNGIGVIVADDKSTLPGNPDILRAPNKFYKTITMKGSTLQDNMQLTLPSSYNQHTFHALNPHIGYLTKTCYTTYTYITTYLIDGTTSTNSHEMVVSNIVTEENSIQNIIPSTVTDIQLSTANIEKSKLYYNGNSQGYFVPDYSSSSLDFLVQPSEIVIPSFNTIHEQQSSSTFRHSILNTQTIEPNSIIVPSKIHSNQYSKINSQLLKTTRTPTIYNRFPKLAIGPIINAMADLISNTLEPPKTEIIKEQSNHLPIYIPIKSSPNDREPVKSFRNTRYTNGLENNQQPFLNGGILISPGDVINANADVIVGKTTNNLVPLNLKEKSMKNDFLKNYYHFDESYLGPPPPPTPPLTAPIPTSPTILQHPPRTQQLSLKNVLVPSQQNFPQQLSSTLQLPLLPPTHFNNLNRPMNIPIRSPPRLQQNLLNNDKYHELNNIPKFQTIPTRIIPFKTQQFTHVVPTVTNEVIEIQQIPEVFHADFPPYRYAYNNSNIFRELPEIVDHKSMLVNVKPSQQANVLIPYGSSTALVFGGVKEQHNHGYYINEPIHHEDIAISVDEVRTIKPSIIPSFDQLQVQVISSIPSSSWGNDNEISAQPSTNYFEVNISDESPLENDDGHILQNNEVQLTQESELRPQIVEVGSNSTTNQTRVQNDFNIPTTSKSTNINSDKNVYFVNNHFQNDDVLIDIKPQFNLISDQRKPFESRKPVQVDTRPFKQNAHEHRRPYQHMATSEAIRPTEHVIPYTIKVSDERLRPENTKNSFENMPFDHLMPPKQQKLDYKFTEMKTPYKTILADNFKVIEQQRPVEHSMDSSKMKIPSQFTTYQHKPVEHILPEMALPSRFLPSDRFNLSQQKPAEKLMMPENQMFSKGLSQQQQKPIEMHSAIKLQFQQRKPIEHIKETQMPSQQRKPIEHIVRRPEIQMPYQQRNPIENTKDLESQISSQERKPIEHIMRPDIQMPYQQRKPTEHMMRPEIIREPLEQKINSEIRKPTEYIVRPETHAQSQQRKPIEEYSTRPNMQMSSQEQKPTEHKIIPETQHQPRKPIEQKIIQDTQKLSQQRKQIDEHLLRSEMPLQHQKPIENLMRPEVKKPSKSFPQNQRKPVEQIMPPEIKMHQSTIPSDRLTPPKRDKADANLINTKTKTPHSNNYNRPQYIEMNKPADHLTPPQDMTVSYVMPKDQQNTSSTTEHLLIVEHQKTPADHLVPPPQRKPLTKIHEQRKQINEIKIHAHDQKIETSEEKPTMINETVVNEVLESSTAKSQESTILDKTSTNNPHLRRTQSYTYSKNNYDSFTTPSSLDTKFTRPRLRVSHVSYIHPATTRFTKYNPIPRTPVYLYSSITRDIKSSISTIIPEISTSRTITSTAAEDFTISKKETSSNSMIIMPTTLSMAVSDILLQTVENETMLNTYESTTLILNQTAETTTNMPTTEILNNENNNLMSATNYIINSTFANINILAIQPTKALPSNDNNQFEIFNISLNSTNSFNPKFTSNGSKTFDRTIESILLLASQINATPITPNLVNSSRRFYIEPIDQATYGTSKVQDYYETKSKSILNLAKEVEDVIEDGPLEDDEELLDEFIIDNDSSFQFLENINKIDKNHSSNFIITHDEEKYDDIETIPEVYDINVGTSFGGNRKMIILNDNNNFGTRDEEDQNTNKDQNILNGGVLVASVFDFSNDEDNFVENNSSRRRQNNCSRNCDGLKNEVCVDISKKQSSCMCRKGFTRTFADLPCNPIYTYSLNIDIINTGGLLNDSIFDKNSSQHSEFKSKIENGLHRMIMQSNMRDLYHGIQVIEFKRQDNNQRAILCKFLLQLSQSTNSKYLHEVLEDYLKFNNNSIGGTNIYATARRNINIDDFNECSNGNFNDCLDGHHCFNIYGSYKCSCNDGFTDISLNPLYPGRSCIREAETCDECNYHGYCFYQEGTNVTNCICYRWFAGSKCNINLKVLLISLCVIGIMLLLLFTWYMVIYACRSKPSNTSMMPQYAANTFAVLPKFPEASDKGMKPKTRSNKTNSVCSESTNSSNSVHIIIKKKNGKKNNTKENYSQDECDVAIPRAKYQPQLFNFYKNKHVRMPASNYKDDRVPLQNDKSNKEMQESRSKRNSLQKDQILQSSNKKKDSHSNSNLITLEDKKYVLDNYIFTEHKTIFPFDTSCDKSLNDEANTMAERDMGSTVLLPHTHLYKTEKDSVSDFDSERM